MAELNTVQQSSSGIKRAPKKSSKPDMTPLVDLGFLLITFFMFTTTFTKPNMLKLSMPDNSGPHTQMKSKNTINIILGKDNRIFYHQSDIEEVADAHFTETDYSAAGIRSAILKLKNAAPDISKFTVIIKPTEQASFKNTVDILDEMEITGSPRYAITDLSELEKSSYQNKIALSLLKSK
jgi:biopolymer transport protein ExbD